MNGHTDTATHAHVVLDPDDVPAIIIRLELERSQPIIGYNSAATDDPKRLIAWVASQTQLHELLKEAFIAVGRPLNLDNEAGDDASF